MPPHKGHQKIVNTIKQLAQENDCDYTIFTPNPKKYALTNTEHLFLLQECFGEMVMSFPRFCDVIHYINDCEYESAIMVIGADRLNDFKRMLLSYEREARNPMALAVISGGHRDASQASVEGLSSTKMKEYVERGQRYLFLDNVPDSMSQNTALMLYNKLRNAK